jgi:hypothetical protein
MERKQESRPYAVWELTRDAADKVSSRAIGNFTSYDKALDIGAHHAGTRDLHRYGPESWAYYGVERTVVITALQRRASGRPQ